MLMKVKKNAKFGWVKPIVDVESIPLVNVAYFFLCFSGLSLFFTYLHTRCYVHCRRFSADSPSIRLSQSYVTRASLSHLNRLQMRCLHVRCLRFSGVSLLIRCARSSLALTRRSVCLCVHHRLTFFFSHTLLLLLFISKNVCCMAMRSL